MYALTFDERDRLASGSDDHTIRIWNVLNGDCGVRVMRAHSEAVVQVHFGSSELLVSASKNQTIRTWRLDRGDVPEHVTAVKTPITRFNNGFAGISTQSDSDTNKEAEAANQVEVDHLASGSEDATMLIPANAFEH